MDSPITIIAWIILSVAVLIALYGLYSERGVIKTIVKNRGKASFSMWADTSCVILSVLSAFMNHISMVDQYCLPADSLDIICSAYQGYTAGYHFSVGLSGVLNGLLTYSVNLLCLSRWKQMKRNVYFSATLHRCVSTFATLLLMVKIVTQILAVSTQALASNPRMNIAVAASSAAFTISSVIFDIVICFLIASAVLKTQVNVQKMEKTAILRREHTKFRVALIGLLAVDIVEIAIILSLRTLSTDLIPSGICIGVAAMVIHAFISKELLRQFVDKLLTKDQAKGASSSQGNKRNSAYINSKADNLVEVQRSTSLHDSAVVNC